MGDWYRTLNSAVHEGSLPLAGDGAALLKILASQSREAEAGIPGEIGGTVQSGGQKHAWPLECHRLERSHTPVPS